MTLEDKYSAETIAKLRAFSTGARTATPLHPTDERRFVEFVLAAYREEPDISSVALRDWLRENAWTEERADLMVRYLEGAVMVLDLQGGRI